MLRQTGWEIVDLGRVSAYQRAKTVGLYLLPVRAKKTPVALLIPIDPY